MAQVESIKQITFFLPFHDVYEGHSSWDSAKLSIDWEHQIKDTTKPLK